MTALADIASGVYGAWRLARRDPAALGLFDDSRRGFIRSFIAALMVLPAVLILDAVDGNMADEALTARGVSVELIAYVIQWTAFPLVMAGITDSLGRGHLWVRYVVAYNWASVIQMALFLPVGILTMLDPEGPAVLLNLVVTVVLLLYLAYVAKVALELPATVAAGIVLLDLLLGSLINMVAERIAG